MMSSTVKWALVGLAGAAIAVPAAVASGAIARDEIEIPAYAVEQTFDDFEVRVYEPRLVAHVTVEGSPRKASSAGFRLLADFIFGNNVANEKVAMTAPVEQQQQSEKIAMTAPVDRQQSADESEAARWVVTFTMPSKYTMETIPKPKDDRVQLELIPKERHAVVRFSGSPSERAVERRMETLAEAVEEAGLETAGQPPVYSRYDPPWTLPFMRRNEIAIELLPPTPTE